MALDSLPRFPEGKPAPTPAATEPEPVASGRRTTMLLQALFLVGFWAGIYTLHQQSRIISAAYHKAEQEAKADAALEGKWQSTHGDGTILEMRNKRFTLTRPGGLGDWRLLTGNSTREGDKLSLAATPWEAPPYGTSVSFHYRVDAEHLVAWGEAYVLRRIVFGRETPIDQRELRFKRIGE